VAVAWSKSGPRALESVALPATLYQPGMFVASISATAPEGLTPAAPFLLSLTVGVRPVFPVKWSAASSIRNTSGCAVEDCLRSFMGA
jgi:hypothetical protein